MAPHLETRFQVDKPHPRKRRGGEVNSGRALRLDQWQLTLCTALAQFLIIGADGEIASPLGLTNHLLD